MESTNQSTDMTAESLLARLESANEIDEVFDITDHLNLNIDEDDISLLKIKVKQHLLVRLYHSQQITYRHEVKKLNEISIDDYDARTTLSKLYVAVKDLAEKFDKSFANGLDYPCKEAIEIMKSDYVLLQEKFQYPILITGETSAGKSSLLNYLLGVDIISVHTLSCTNRICEITYGEFPQIKCINCYNNKQVYAETWTIDSKDEAVKKIQSLITEQGLFENLNKENETKTSKEGNYLIVRIYWPSEFLKSGILIVDSPGIGEKVEMPQPLKNYIFKAVAYIIVINSAAAGGIQEERLQRLLHQISNTLRNNGYVNFNPSMALFVCNKWDTVPICDREAVKTDSVTKLKKCWPGMTESQMVFLSVKELLMTRANIKDNALVPPEVVRLFDMLCNLIPVSRKQKLSKSYSFLRGFVEEVQDTCQCYLVRAESMVTELKGKESKQKYLETATKQCLKELTSEKNALIKTLITKYQKFIETLYNDSLINWSENDVLDKEFETDSLMKLQKHADFKVRQRLNNQLKFIANDMYQHLLDAKDLLLEKFISRLDTIIYQVQSNLDEFTDAKNKIHIHDFDLDQRAGYMQFSELYRLSDIWANMNAVKRATVIMTSPFWISPAFIVSPIYYVTKFVKSRNQQKEIQKFKENKTSQMRRFTLLFLEHIGTEDFARKYIVEKFDLLITSLLNNVKNIILKSLQRRIGIIKQALKDKRSLEEVRKLYKPILEETEQLLLKLNDFYLLEFSESSIKFKDLLGYNEESTPLSSGLKVNLFRASLRKGEILTDVILQVPIDKSTRNMHDFVNDCQILRTLESQNAAKFLSICYTPLPTITAIGIFKNYKMTLQYLIFKDPTIVNESDTQINRMKKIYTIVYQIIQGITYLHENELIHAHLTSGNVLIENNEENQFKIKLCHATKQCKLYDGDDFEESIISYLAPEVLKDRSYKEASDIYSFAILFWEIWYWKLITNVFDWNIDTESRQKIDDLRSYKFTPKLFDDISNICFESLCTDPLDRPIIDSWQDIMNYTYYKYCS